MTQKQLPELAQIFSYIICAEDMIDVGEYRIKDMSPLLATRSSEDIIIVDTQSERVDDEIFSSIIVSKYNGSVSYNN